jgi:hypothetical protein
MFSAQWMIQNHPDALLEAFPDLLDRRTVGGSRPPAARHFFLGRHSGASLWLRRRGEDREKRSAAR